MRVATISVQILGGINLNERRNKRHYNKDCDGETINVLADSQRHTIVLPPRPSPDDGLDVCFFGYAIDALNPLVCRTKRHHQCSKHRQNSELGTLHRHLLAKENNQCKRNRRDNRDDEGIFKEPAGLKDDFSSFGRCREHELALHL
jgi:hypothetical protein